MNIIKYLFLFDLRVSVVCAMLKGVFKPGRCPVIKERAAHIRFGIIGGRRSDVFNLIAGYGDAVEPHGLITEPGRQVVSHLEYAHQADFALQGGMSGFVAQKTILDNLHRKIGIVAVYAGLYHAL